MEEKSKDTFDQEDFQRSYILNHIGGNQTHEYIIICGSV